MSKRHYHHRAKGDSRADSSQSSRFQTGPEVSAQQRDLVALALGSGFPRSLGQKCPYLSVCLLHVSASESLNLSLSLCLSVCLPLPSSPGCVCVCVHVCLLASVSYLPSPTPSLVKMRKSTFGGCPANLNPALPINN